MRRQLWETLVEIAGGAVDEGGKLPGITLAELGLDLPLEVTLAPSEDGWVLLADAPAWRWQTEFDREPGRFAMVIGIWEGFDA